MRKLPVTLGEEVDFSFLHPLQLASHDLDACIVKKTAEPI